MEEDGGLVAVGGVLLEDEMFGAEVLGVCMWWVVLKV